MGMRMPWPMRSWEKHMPAKIEAKEFKLSRVFSNDYEYSIPEYQRPYAWETEQVVVLLDDLTYAGTLRPWAASY